jgi:hypothetical protein
MALRNRAFATLAPTSNRKGGHLTERAVNGIVKRTARKASINDAISPHSLPSTRGASLPDVAQSSPFRRPNDVERVLAGVDADHGNGCADATHGRLAAPVWWSPATLAMVKVIREIVPYKLGGAACFLFPSEVSIVGSIPANDWCWRAVRNGETFR